jgi:PAS domain S-box-containing protein
MKNVFNSLPGLFLILQPNSPIFTIVEANNGYLKNTGIDRTAFGKPLFEVFPDNPGDPNANGVVNLSNSLMEVIHSKKPATMDVQRYDTWNQHTKQFDTRYWGVLNIPVFDEENNLVNIIHSVENKTEQILLKQSEEKVKQELQQLHHLQHSIIENLEEGYISVDNSWIVTHCNRHTELLLSRPCNNVVGNNLFELIEGEEMETFAALCKEAFAEKNSKHFELHVEQKNRWLIINIYPSNEGLIIFLVDNTDVKHEQEKLQDNEKRFRALLENIADGIIILGANTEILELSQSAQNILKIEKDIVGQELETIFFRDDIALILRTFEQVVKTHKAVSTIQFRFLQNGTVRWLEGTFQNLLDERSVKAVILICRDITDRIIYEEQLKLSEKKYRKLFHSSPATIIIWTLADFRIKEANQTAIELYGYTLEEFQSMTVLDIRPVEEQQRIIDIAIEMREKHVRQTSLSVHLNRQQKRMYMNIAYFKMVYNGEPAIMSLAVDQTEKIKLEETLEKERKRMQNEITEAVINAQENERAELSKELHDNINQVLTTARLMIERGLANKMNQEEVLQLNLKYLTTAINEIRKLSQSLMPPSLNEITLHDALSQLISNYNALKLFKINYTNDLEEEDILNAPTKLTIFRIIQEQLNNIVKHSGATIVALKISYKEHLLSISVSDNGKGFIVNADNAGLGLKNITSRAHLFNGQVSIQSELNKGTELKVQFTV